MAVLGVLSGCEGLAVIATGPICDAFPQARVRRLTRAEFDNSVAQLLGKPSSYGQALAVEDVVNGFSNHDGLEVSPLLADQIDSAAQKAVSEGGEQLLAQAPCPQGRAEADCAKDFIVQFGRRAFRRPLSDEEVADLQALYAAGREGGSYRSGIELAAQGMLESSSFWYRTELGPEGAGGAKVELTPFEVASAISFLVVASPPDTALLDAAAADELKTPDQREAQVRRLLEDARARAQMRSFVTQWLGIDNVGALQKDNNIFPDFSVALRDSMQAETSAFLDSVLFEGDGTVKSLLAADYSFVDRRLGTLYGVAGASSLSETTVSKVKLPPERAGILNQAAFLATYSHNVDSSPVKRGKFVRTKLLCQPLPPPPANLVVTPPALNTKMTTRQRVFAHSSNGACWSCHRLMDPIGYGMEDFDGIGKYRTTENGLPVDAQGEINEARDMEPSFRGGADLARKLAASQEVSDCVTKQMFRYGLGRAETPEDSCSLVYANSYTGMKGGSLKEQLVGLVRSNAFTTRKLGQKE